MTKGIDEIVSDVRICMDEIGNNDGEFVGGSDDSELNTIIKSKIEDAYNFVYGNADIALLGLGACETIDIYDGSDEKSFIFKFNDDYLRFVQGFVNTWVKPVLETIKPDDPLFTAVFDIYVGASVSRPAILEYKDYDYENQTSKHVIRLVGRKNTENEKGVVWYIPKLTLDSSSEEIEVNEKIYRAVVYYCAGLTYLTFNDKSRAQELLEMAMTLMGANNKE